MKVTVKDVFEIVVEEADGALLTVDEEGETDEDGVAAAVAQPVKDAHSAKEKKVRIIFVRRMPPPSFFLL